MRSGAPEFSSRLELPCTVSHGDGEVKLRGVVFQIESARVTLQLKRRRQALRLGDEVRLDVHLPAEAGIAAKDMTVRGRITQISDHRDGAEIYVLSFRRAQFKDRLKASAPVKSKAAPAGWRM
jgi:hypothetical protein